MIKYRLLILAFIYILVILASFMIYSSRGCYTHSRADAVMASLVPAKFYFYSKKFTTVELLKRGDIVLFDVPGAPGTLHVRRILGKPGDQVALTREGFQVNGEPYRPPFITSNLIPPGMALAPIAVPGGMLFVIPDNMSALDINARDCFVPLSKVRGKFLDTIFKDDSL